MLALGITFLCHFFSCSNWECRGYAYFTLAAGSGSGYRNERRRRKVLRVDTFLKHQQAA